MTNPPNFKPGVGRLTTDRYDFESHLKGQNPAGFNNFRHTADQTDMNPPVIGGATTVQGSLDEVAAFIAGQSGVGQGFVTVGDGYDTWHLANGQFNFDVSIPSLDTLLNPIFASIIAYQNAVLGGAPIIPPVSSGFDRVKSGGIIVIKAGMYIVKNSITVPPGIILIGEGYGTKICNATSLDFTNLPPIVKSVPTPAPLFIIAADSNRTSDDAPVDSNLFMFARDTKIMNLVICDNFVEPTLLGDVNYRAPQNRLSVSPLVTVAPGLIQQEAGSRFTLDNVSMLGRASVSGTTATQATSYVVFLDTTFPAPNGTFCKITNCFIDGFAYVANFSGTASSNDYLEITNSKIRAYGVFPTLSAFVIANDNNVLISNNTLYADSFTGSSTSLLFLGAHGSAPAGSQGRGKIIITGNNVNGDKTTSSNPFITLIHDTLPIMPTYATALVYGNNITSEYDVQVDDQLVYTSASVTAGVGTVTVDPIGTNSSVVLSPNGSNSNVTVGPTFINNGGGVRNAITNVMIAPNSTAHAIGGAGHATATVTINPIASGTGTFGTTTTTAIQLTSLNGIIDGYAGTDINLTSGATGLLGNVNISALSLNTSNHGNVNITSSHGHVNVTGPIIGNSTNNESLRFGYVTIDLTGVGSSYALLASEFNVNTIILVGVLSADCNVIIPADAGITKIIENRTKYAGAFGTYGSEGYRIYVSNGSGNRVYLTPQAKTTLYSDGSAIYGTVSPRYMPISAESQLVYQFVENKSSTVAFSSGNQVQALSQTFVGGSGSSPGFVGILDNCLYFAGGANREYYSSGTNDGGIHASAPFRVSMWVKPFFITSGDSWFCGKLFGPSNGSWAQKFFIFGLFMDNGGHLGGTIACNSVNSTTFSSGVSMDIGQWNHIGMTYDGTQAQLFLNGNLIYHQTAFLSGGLAVGTNGPWFVGAVPNPGSGTPTQTPMYADDFRYEDGDAIVLTNAVNWFADVYRMGMGRFDDIGK